MGVTPAESPPPDALARAQGESPRDRLVSRGAWTAAVAFAVATAGAVDPAAAAALAALFLVLVLAFALPGPAPFADAPRAARLAVGALLLACALQLLPLPEPVRALLAPGATAARADLRALGVGGGWAPISVDVGATVFEAVLWAGAAALLVLLSRPAGPPSGARLAVALLVALHVFAWGDLLLGTRIFPLTHIEDPWGVGQETLRAADFSGWLINRNHWAALGVVLWPIAAAWALPRTGVARGIGFLAAAAVIASVVATKSRAGLGVVGLQGLAVAVILAARAPRRVRLVAFAAIVGAVLLARGPIASFFERATAADVLGRRDLYLATGRMAAASPLVGWGMGTFQSTYPAYQPEGALYKYSHAHCDPLEWIAGAGVLGLLACAALGARVVSGARDGGAPAFARVAWTLSVLGGAAAACVEFPLQVPALRFVWLGVLFAGPRALPASDRVRDRERA